MNFCIFFYFLIMIEGKRNFIHQPFFDICFNTACNGTGIWYNGENSSQPYISTYSPINQTHNLTFLEMSSTYWKICQNLSVQFHSNFEFSLIALFEGVDEPYFELMLDQQVLIEQFVPNNGFIYMHNLKELNQGENELCLNFSDSNQNQTLLIRRVFMRIYQFYQQALFYVSQDQSAINSIVITVVFNDYLNARYWVDQTLDDKVTISIHDQDLTQEQVIQIYNGNDSVKFQVPIFKTINENSQISLNFHENDIHTDFAYFILIDQRLGEKIPTVLYQYENQINPVVSAIGKTISTASSGVALVGASYLVVNLFVFSNLIVLYNYLDFQWVLVKNRIAINTILQMFLVEGDITGLIQAIFGSPIIIGENSNVEEKIQPNQQVNGMYEHGFRSNFFINSWDELLNIGLMIFKIFIARLFQFLPLKFLIKFGKRVQKKAKIYILYEILTGAPTIVLPIAFILSPKGNMGSKNIFCKINLVLFTLYYFILFFTPFLIFYSEVRFFRKRKRIPKIQTQKNESSAKPIASFSQLQNTQSHLQSENKFTNKSISFHNLSPTKFNDEQEKCKITFLENCLLIIIPFLIGIGNVNLCIIVSSLIMTFRIIFLIRMRKYYEKWNFFKAIFNRCAWLSFIIIYFVYWILEKIQITNPDEESFLNFLDNLGKASIWIIFLGIGGEGLFLVIDILIWIIKMIIDCKNRYNRVEPIKEEKIQKQDSSKRQKKLVKAYSQNVQRSFEFKVQELEPKLIRFTHKEKKKVDQAPLEQKACLEKILQKKHHNQDIENLFRYC